MEMGFLGDVVDYRIHFGLVKLYHAGGTSNFSILLLYLGLSSLVSLALLCYTLGIRYDGESLGERQHS